jgi:hypothetical protein
MAIADTNDFTSNALVDFGQDVTLIPITTNYDINGHEIEVQGTQSTIKAVYHRSISKFTAEKYGFSDDINAYLMVAPAISIKRNDIIVTSDRKYKVIAVIDRGSASTVSVYKRVDLAHIE